MFRVVFVSGDPSIRWLDSIILPVCILFYYCCLSYFVFVFCCLPNMTVSSCTCMCRYSWPTHPMCSCWSHARMYPNSWITRLRCARVFSASIGTWSWSTRWIHRHGQWDILIHMEDVLHLSSICQSMSPDFIWRLFIAYLLLLLWLFLCFAGSRCCRYCWGSQRQLWRGHRKTKEKTALLKV